MHPYVHHSTIYNSQDGSNLSAHWQMNEKEDVVYIYNEILLSHKNEWSFATCDKIDRTWGHYA